MYNGLNCFRSGVKRRMILDAFTLLLLLGLSIEITWGKGLGGCKVLDLTHDLDRYDSNVTFLEPWNGTTGMF